MRKVRGYSALVELPASRILFDTGNNADIFAQCEAPRVSTFGGWISQSCSIVTATTPAD